MDKIRVFIKENIFLLILTFFVLLNFFVALRLNIFRFNNFDFAKFDQGNMTQMVWNTLRGRVLYLTDYFGSNVPRWAMSHVDPILLLFVPIFAIFPHPMTLAYAQLVLVVLGAYAVYFIADLKLKSKFAACVIGIVFLLYPSLGFINGTMGFHGVTAAIPFFLFAFFLFEKMYKEKFTEKGIILLWALLIITMMGKEQIPLYIFMWGLFILFFRTGTAGEFKPNKLWFKNWFRQMSVRLGMAMMVVGILWFYVAFFVVIPKYAPLRTESYNKFISTINVGAGGNADVTLENFFLGRYGDFGTTYKDVLANMILNPNKVIRVFFGADNPENLRMTFAPLLYLPLASPFTLLISSPDFLINYLTTESGIGSSEIQNHRMSMIIPVLVISIIYAISFISVSFERLIKNEKIGKRVGKAITLVLSSCVLVSTIVADSTYGNPMYLWFTQAVSKRVHAKFDKEVIKRTDLVVGDVVKLSDLDVKDARCAQAVVDKIPDDASVTGPDNLGAHLALRETDAIFPALWDSADYAILDILSRKITGLLQLNSNIVSDTAKTLITSNDHKLLFGCGNLFLFKKEPVVNLPGVDIFPIQERFQYTEKFHYPLIDQISVVDYTLPDKAVRGSPEKAKIVYKRDLLGDLNGYILYMTYVDVETGEVFQVANLPSFAFLSPEKWSKEFYYIENIDVAIPTYVKPGVYRAFLSLTNRIKERGMYLGDIQID